MPMKITTVPLAELHPWPGNARKHDARNLAAITESLATFGQVEPLVVQASTHRVIGGNGRLQAMKNRADPAAQVVLVDLDDAKALALNIALNRTSELAAWDEVAVAAQWRTLEAALQAAAGFTADEMQELLDNVVNPETDVVQDEIPLPPDEPITKPGDLWILGNHRLLCGDSSKPADLDRLLGGQPIHLVNTDPPYNVKVEPRSNNAIAAGLILIPSH